ncbi:MAG: nucleotidyltransferase domain-containing protein [Chloroflexi bacterium]|nr:nucleotidyltransferase domain-containing protein [Chloroflexota bacterium]
MSRRVSVAYRDAAEEFARRVIAALGERIDAIVLYGSVARGEAKRYSDIDVLVIGPSREAEKEVDNIAGNIWERSDYNALITVVYLTREQFRERARSGSPFIANVLEDGVVLFDNGIFVELPERL